ncbi:MAG: hypothetical protein EZS28_007253 [Streblomastix strix]|uniref:Protein kinase domain-containing protein n=1 Tax=Streblomastix strix TaxID=222440 RepID=A0A5J4WSY6_9EUKA|nr:MAG: hypothetical protein EZS28_007253 [Streblomastix strix]
MSFNPVCKGDIVGGKFQTENCVAEGKNTIIFLARWKETIPAVTLALKFEQNIPENIYLKNEIHVMMRLQESNHFTKTVEFGKHGEFNYLAVELLGPNLRDLANRCPPYKLSLQTLLQFAYQAFDALQTLHQAGFVHGAIKAV